MGLAIGSRRARPRCGPDPDDQRPGIPGTTARPARPAPDAGPEEESAMIDPRFGRRPRDPRSRPARRSPRWLGGIECLESRIALASSSLAGGALSVIGTTADQTGHYAPDGFGDLARIGHLPVIGISAPGAGHLVTRGYGDL
jgi:hypothetical protein